MISACSFLDYHPAFNDTFTVTVLICTTCQSIVVMWMLLSAVLLKKWDFNLLFTSLGYKVDLQRNKTINVLAKINATAIITRHA